MLYDKAGIFSAPRVWWTFRAFGHDKCVRLPRVRRSVLPPHLRCETTLLKARRLRCRSCTAWRGALPVPICCRVSVLDGGFPAWSGADLLVDTSPVSEDVLLAAAAAPPAATNFRARLNVRL